MAAIETSCSGTDIDPTAAIPGERKSELSQAQIDHSIHTAALMASGRDNRWSDGLRRVLLYQPESLSGVVGKMDSLGMVKLTDVLQSEGTYTVTPDLLSMALETRYPTRF